MRQQILAQLRSFALVATSLTVLVGDAIAQEGNGHPVVVTVNHGGNLQLGPDKVELGNLKGALRQAIAARGGLAENEAVIIKCDRSVDYGIVARVMARIKEAGYRKLSLVTETEGG